ncbi:hypothetical protein GI582_08850 [Sulfitobacter sp. BDSS02]|nr:hypothetical protein [Sulfitobacter sp. BDSS02]MBR9849921.1 ester cyclase [Paracoccaceae bacterium]
MGRMARTTFKSDPTSVHELWAFLRSAFPDQSFQVRDMIAEDDKVVVQWSLSCTHLVRRIPPTGKKGSVSGIAIYRPANGKIVERWVSTNLEVLKKRLELN